MSIYTLKDGTEVQVVLGQGSDGAYSYMIDEAIDLSTGEFITAEQEQELLSTYEFELQQDWERMADRHHGAHTHWEGEDEDYFKEHPRR